MPRAEVTWNGVAKSYRVGTEVFMQNRSRTEDWSDEMVKYLEATKGFSVVRKDAPAPAPKAEAKKTEAAPAEEKPEEKPAEDEGVTTSASSKPRRTSRRGRSSD